MQVVTQIYLFRNPYTICYINEEVVILANDELYKVLNLNQKAYPDKDNDKEGSSDVVRKRLRLVVSAYFLGLFLRECGNSEAYRHNVVERFKTVSGYDNGTVFLKLILEPPDQEILDYAWNDKMLKLVWTRVEIENAFSWLSTLGGAYSALGDYFEHCAEEAGRISVRQYKLSKMLGDHGLAARSKLYSALSYSQKGNLKISRRIVRNVAQFAKETNDKRLMRMCQGVWAKLKYLRVLRKNANLQAGDKGNGNVINGIN
ncbi:uncharacterized protein LOC106129908 [Amyelois transitella]|uniref:uncharacterized protein LOC106129908 n=1 Tax=Amyelois transitella TaxID=680683 RepID=UPI00298F649F|nr:uncharacterized protein LOC106129908 [Amyelois transitella]